MAASRTCVCLQFVVTFLQHSCLRFVLRRQRLYVRWLSRRPAIVVADNIKLNVSDAEAQAMPVGDASVMPMLLQITGAFMTKRKQSSEWSHCILLPWWQHELKSVLFQTHARNFPGINLVFWTYPADKSWPVIPNSIESRLCFGLQLLSTGLASGASLSISFSSYFSNSFGLLSVLTTCVCVPTPNRNNTRVEIQLTP